MNIMKRLKNKKGFSLIENILSTTILATGLVAGLMTMQNAVVNTVQGDMNTVATQKANEKVEEILADNTYRSFEFIDGSNYATELMDDSYGMTRYVSVTEVSADDLETPEANTGFKKVDVTVSWGEENYQRVVVSTLITDNDN